MKLSEIRHAVNVDIDDTFQVADIDRWVNRCLLDLTPIAKKNAKTTYTIDSTNSYTLPANFHDFAYIIVKNQGSTSGERFRLITPDDFESKGFKYWENKIELQKAPENGTVELYYYRELAILANPDDVPEIEEAFQDMLILYAVAKTQYADEEFEDQSIVMNEYLNRKLEYKRYIQRKHKTGRVRDVY